MPVQETRFRPNGLHNVTKADIHRRERLLREGAALHSSAYLAFNGTSTLMRMIMPTLFNQTPRCPKGTRWVKSITKSGALRGCQKQNGTWHGPYKSIYPNGKKAEKGMFVNGKKDGLWKAWHPNGKKKEEGKYVYGKLRGRVKIWHPNGKKKEEGQYVNGKQHGLWKSWHPSGKQKAGVTFINGKKKHGVSKKRDSSGALKEIETYTRGVLHGKFWMRLANGGTIEGHHRNGKEHGTILIKDHKGKVLHRCTMKMGEYEGCTP